MGCPKFMTCSLAVLILATGYVYAAQEASSIEEVKVRETRLEKALVEQDTRALAGLLTDDFIRVPPTTPDTTKAQWIAQVGSGELRYLSIERRDAKYRVFGETVLVNARTHIRAHRITGEDVEIVLRQLSVWVKQKGEWRLAAVQANESPKI